MKRTITMKYAAAYYGGKRIDYVMLNVRTYFKLRDSETHKYVITIVLAKDGEYRLVTDYEGSYNIWQIYGDDMENDTFIGSICTRYFRKLFFTADQRRRYNITVKKVRIKSEKK